MARTGKRFSELISDIPIYPLKKAKLTCTNEKKGPVMEKLSETLSKELENVVDIITVDGIGVTLKDGWILVRPSGTEPVIRITCEGQTEDMVNKTLAAAKEIVGKTIKSA